MQRLVERPDDVASQHCASAMFSPMVLPVTVMRIAVQQMARSAFITAGTPPA